MVKSFVPEGIKKEKTNVLLRSSPTLEVFSIDQNDFRIMTSIMTSQIAKVILHNYTLFRIYTETLFITRFISTDNYGSGLNQKEKK